MNPYEAPQSELRTLPVAQEAATLPLCRDGQDLILHDHHVLPAFCVFTNQPVTAVEYQERNFPITKGFTPLVMAVICFVVGMILYGAAANTLHHQLPHMLLGGMAGGLISGVMLIFPGLQRSLVKGYALRYAISNDLVRFQLFEIIYLIIVGGIGSALIWNWKFPNDWYLLAGLLLMFGIMMLPTLARKLRGQATNFRLLQRPDGKLVLRGCHPDFVARFPELATLT
jgi:hypothetical protein